MIGTAPAAFVDALAALPEGSSTGDYQGKRYLATKSTYNAGRSIKLVARELGGSDYISFNLYLLTSGPKLFPCEMSRTKVIAFLAGFQPDDGLA